MKDGHFSLGNLNWKLEETETDLIKVKTDGVEKSEPLSLKF